MLVLVGASASGKTEIAKIIMRKYGFKKMVTYTTREKRPGETDGVDYHFLSETDFEKKRQNRDFIETTTYNGNHYGTAFSETGRDKVLIVNVEGANSLYARIPDAMVIFLLHSPEKLRKTRMLERGDDIETAKERLKKDTALFRRDRLNHVDHIIENGHGLSLDALADTIYARYMNDIENQA